MTMHYFYRPFSAQFRKQRLNLLTRTLSMGPTMKILDIGGNSFFWERLFRLLGPRMPRITVVNLYERPSDLPPFVRWVMGDGRGLPFGDRVFDLAFCNSVIEHLGTLESQIALASEVRRVARQYWVQTPDRRFFIEPHFVAPFVHWLPKKAQRRILRRGSLWGLVAHPTREDIDRVLAEVRLLGPYEFHFLFPDAEIKVERFVGLPKSLIAVRQ
jgi:Methyltransferase domain